MGRADFSPSSDVFEQVFKVQLSTVSSLPLGCDVDSAMNVVVLSPHHHGM